MPLALVSALLLLGACVDDEQVFTEGRLEDLCNEAIPSCHSVKAACELSTDEFFRGEFPGGLRVITRSERDQATLVVRLMLTGMISPGSELHIQAHLPDCSNLAEEHPTDVDLFKLAGDDRILEYHLDMPGRGDHLIEVYSDMASTYLMTLTIEEKK